MKENAPEERNGVAPRHAPANGANAVRINGEWHGAPETGMVLMDWLRGELSIESPKPACDSGHCGNCAVLLDGRPAKSCTVLTDTLIGSDVVTLEGFERNPGKLSALNDACNQPAVFQCGYCKPGFVFACHALLASNPEPSRNDIRAAFAGVLCRCTGYQTIVDAVEKAIQNMRQRDRNAPQPRIHRPGSLSAALQLSARLPGSRWLAGGQQLVPALRRATEKPAELIDIEGIEALKGISILEGNLHIGACCTHADIAASPVVDQSLPKLAEVAGHIGDVYVRSRGTLGGNLVSNARDGCYSPLLIAAGAWILGRSGAIPADEWFSAGAASTELIVGVRIPVPRSLFHRNFRQRPGRAALIGVTAARAADGHVRIGIAGYAACAFRAPDPEMLLRGLDQPEANDTLPALLGRDPVDDTYAHGAYRTAILRELLLGLRGDLAASA
ncbi:FAD binding domain-containing protein [Bordetella genomosp. 10]|nr:FAD binding domain-containing protein [Bordetella genomosp. 10]